MTDQSGAFDMTRRVTANLWFWQGLRWAPMGALATGAALFVASAPEPAVGWACYVAALALGWWLYRLADAYYVRRYGVVRLALGQHRRRDQVKWLAVYPAMVAAIVV